MAEITPEGVIETTFPEYLEEIQNTFRDAFGGQIVFDEQTPQGQITWLLAKIAHDFEQNVLDVARSLDIIQAEGQQLDDLASLLGVVRHGATYSTVTGILSGTSGAVIPANSIASTVNGDRFLLLSPVTLNNLGEGSGTFRAEKAGAVYVGRNELVNIVTVVSGWDSVTNDTAGSVGSDEETDSEFTARYYTELFAPSVSMFDSIRANISKLDDVQSVTGVENVTNDIQDMKDISVAPHGFIMAVEGGETSEIAEVIRKYKSLGSAPYYPVAVKVTGDTGSTGQIVPAGTVITYTVLSKDFMFINDVTLTEGVEVASAVACVDSGSISISRGATFGNLPSGVSSVQVTHPNGSMDSFTYVYENQMVPVYTVDGAQVVQNIPVSIKRIEPVPVKIKIHIREYAGFPIDGVQQIRDAIESYIGGTNQFTDKFELDGLKAGESLFASRLYTPVNSVQGCEVIELYVGLKSDSGDPTGTELTAGIAERFMLEDKDTDITFELSYS